MNVTETYVVTFDMRNPTTISNLRRMTLAEARDLLALAGRIPKRGAIVNADTLQILA